MVHRHKGSGPANECDRCRTSFFGQPERHAVITTLRVQPLGHGRRAGGNDAPAMAASPPQGVVGASGASPRSGRSGWPGMSGSLLDGGPCGGGPLMVAAATAPAPPRRTAAVATAAVRCRRFISVVLPPRFSFHVATECPAALKATVPRPRCEDARVRPPLMQTKPMRAAGVDLEGPPP
jgi:hypothetical protein